MDRIKEHKLSLRNLFKLLISLNIVLLFFTVASAQEVTEGELQRALEIRDRLLKNGFLEPENQLPLPQLNAQFLLEDAWYTQKKLNSATFSSRASHFSPDGKRFYILGRGERNIVEYELDEPWEINTAAYVRELDIYDEVSQTEDRPTAPHGMYLRNDGEKLWVLNRTEIWQYSLSDPWNITSAEPEARQDLIDNVVRGHDFEFKPDGSVLYVDDRILGVIFQYQLSDEWDVTTIDLDYVLDISDQQEAVRGINIRENGKKMFLMDTNRQEVLEYNISSPYDLRTASYSGAFSVASESSSPEGLFVKPDSRIFYVTANFDDQVHQYKISEIDTQESSVDVASEKVDADRNNYSEIEVFIRDSDGDEFPGVKVELSFDSGSPILQEINDITDKDGRARFRLRSEVAQIVQVKIVAERNGEEFELPDQPVVRFVPPSPVALSATDEETTRFTANWELVEIASSYLIDVAEDMEFENIVQGYDEFDVGNVTNYTVENLSPGKSYYYRIVALSNGIKGNGSQIQEVELYPETPVANAARNISATNFTAAWSDAEGAQSYLLDVSGDENFSNIIESYNSINVGDVTESSIRNLIPGTTYYFRVRSNSGSRVSDSSNTISVSTQEIDFNNSRIDLDQLRILANGQQSNNISIRIVSPEGEPIDGEKIMITPESGSSVIKIIQDVTDEDGTAHFEVTNTAAEIVNYQVYVSNDIELGRFSVEFLQGSNELQLGSNFPNPFSDITYIPLNVPGSTDIQLVLINSFGRVVRTIVDERLNEGYYEFSIDLSGLASGTYFYSLITNQKKDTRKMMYIK